jgi:hypothetical protein
VFKNVLSNAIFQQQWRTSTGHLNQGVKNPRSAFHKLKSANFEEKISSMWSGLEEPSEC